MQDTIAIGAACHRPPPVVVGSRFAAGVPKPPLPPRWERLPVADAGAGRCCVSASSREGFFTFTMLTISCARRDSNGERSER